jgi:hypothetical protein
VNVKFRVLIAILVWCGVIYARTLTNNLLSWNPMWILWVLGSGVTAAYAGWEIHTWFMCRKGQVK